MNKFFSKSWRLWWAAQAIGMTIISLCASYLPLYFPAAVIVLRIIFLWILPPLFGAWTACRATHLGLISYAAWLLPPILHTAIPWIAIGYPPAPLSMLLCAFISLIGAASGDVLYRRDNE